MSPLGLYNWDNTLFDDMSIPAEMSKNLLIENLLAETAELEVLYPNPVVMKSLITVWSRKQLPVWEKLYATTQFDYNPIENYDRKETGTTTGTATTERAGTADDIDTTTRSGSDTVHTDWQDESGGSDTVEAEKLHSVAAFDTPTVGAMVQNYKDEDDGTTTYGKTNEGSSDVVTTYGGKDTTTSERRNNETVQQSNDGGHTLRAHGNIGVTTTQEMIRQEREVDEFNIYDYIIRDFTLRFCLLVY